MISAVTQEGQKSQDGGYNHTIKALPLFLRVMHIKRKPGFDYEVRVPFWIFCPPPAGLEATHFTYKKLLCLYFLSLPTNDLEGLGWAQETRI